LKSIALEHRRQVRIHTHIATSLFIGVLAVPVVIVHILDQAQTLGDLPCREFIFVPVPEASAASIVAVMANAMALESNVFVSHAIFQLLQVEVGILAVDACLASFRLHFESSQGGFQLGRDFYGWLSPCPLLHTSGFPPCSTKSFLS
jgi:hypothetical protein